MRVNCLSCGHTLDLGDAYDQYRGQVRCYVCGALLSINTEDGRMKSAAMAGRRECDKISAETDSWQA